MHVFTGVVLDKMSENVNAVEMAGYEDDFEPEDSEKSSADNTDNGEYIWHKCEK